MIWRTLLNQHRRSDAPQQGDRGGGQFPLNCSVPLGAVGGLGCAGALWPRIFVTTQAVQREGMRMVDP